MTSLRPLRKGKCRVYFKQNKNSALLPWADCITMKCTTSWDDTIGNQNSFEHTGSGIEHPHGNAATDKFAELLLQFCDPWSAGQPA